MKKNPLRMIWILLGFLCLGLGTVGILLPILPTVPFYMATVFCFAKSSRKLHDWFIGTRLYRNHLDSFVKQRAMTKETKLRIIAKKFLGKYWGIYTELGDSFLENLQGLTTLKIYQADEKKAGEMDEESQRFRRITMKVLTMQLNSTSVMDIIAYGGAAAGMIVALREFTIGNVSFAGATMIILLSSEFFIPLRLLGSFFHIAMNGMAASDKIFALLDLPEPEEKGIKLERKPTDIRLEDVQFAYGEDRGILKGITMEFKEGSFISLVGTSGCGKSTIAGILMRRNKGYQGSIKIQGKELSLVSEESLMNLITLVSHNSYLFKGTVRDNLLLGKENASEEEMYDVLKKVNLYGFVMGQQGLDTVIMEKGSNFSGGQCQRLALARALLHDTPVYIFDEATSNIDMESEEMIMDVIQELASKKTILLISHRLANVVDSDRIYMLGQRQVVQCGSHAELMESGGPYAELYYCQRQLEVYGQEQRTERETAGELSGTGQKIAEELSGTGQKIAREVKRKAVMG